MNKRKGLLCFFLAAVLLLLSACGGGGIAVTTVLPGTTVPEPTAAPETTPPSSYDVTFVVNGTETKVTVAPGEIPVYEGKTDWETSEHFYKIVGWDKEFAPADCDVTYTATVGEYGLTLYDVRFNMPGGIIKTEVHEGEMPTPPAGYDAPHLTLERVGTFTGWDKELTPPTSENMSGKTRVVYTPVYSYATRYYTITFRIGEAEYSLSLTANAIPECPVVVQNPDGEDVSTRFVGWDKEIEAVKEDTVYTAVFGNAAVVLKAKNGAKAIMSMTFDDGIYDTAVWLDSEFATYGLRGSSMMIPKKNLGFDVYNGPNADVNKWAALFANGRLEPESHSMTHAVLPSDSWANNNDVNTLTHNYQQNYTYELVNSRALLQQAFPGSPILCFAPSNNTRSSWSYLTDASGKFILFDGEKIKSEDGGAQAVVNRTYYAVRQGSRGFQSLDPAFGSTAGSWHNLYMHGFGDAKNDLATAKGWVNTALSDGGWLVTMCHGINVSDGDMTRSVADQYFAYVSQFVSSGELWSASFGEATKYIRERQNTTVGERFENGVVYLDMTINRTTEDNLTLAEDVFNYPLTVEVRVPADWSAVSYTDAGLSRRATSYVNSADGQTYVMVNVTPGADGITTTTQIQKAQS